MPSYDAIIIGAGTNGLACATKLAISGRKVLVLEAGATSGGCANTVEFAPGYRVSGLAHLHQGLDPRVVAGMNLAQHGLLSAATDLTTTALSETGDHLTIKGGTLSTSPDTASYPELHRRLTAFASVLAPFCAMTPPRIARGTGNEYLRLAKLGLGLRMLGRDEFREFLRMILINVADVLEDDLTDDRLKGALAFDATLGAWLGPRSPNSLILLLNRMSMGNSLVIPKGGMGSIAAAMEAALKAAGGTLRTNAAVARIIVEADRAVGVTLTSGEDLRATQIISAINPRTTFQKLVGPQHLDAGFYKRTQHIRSRGAAAKLHLALNGTPDFRGADLKSRLVIAPSIRAVEDSFNAVKYGEVPAKPVLEAILPSAHEADFAPNGCHTLSAVVQFAPHDPKAGQQAAREQMLENTLAMLETHAPGLRAMILHAELLMPYDIEARFGMVGGNWHHGELAVEQMLFLRPLPEAAQYSTPLPGLWLAGAGNHPGGGITGAAGWNAAERILRGGGK
jgi:phytoene dehydrogenase-like protein